MTTYTQPKRAGTPTWTDLSAHDSDAARKFYQAVFGWQYDIGGPEYGGYATARLGQRTTAGIASPMPGAPPAPPAWSVYFASENHEADVARAMTLGAKVLMPAMTVGAMGGMAMCQDPTGAAFGFWKAGQHIGWQVSDEPGAVAWCEMYSTDAKRARDFYTALLGAASEAVPGGMEYYMLKHGDKNLGGIMQIASSWGNMPSQWMPYFAVANAEETLATVKRNGGKALSKVDDSPFGRIAAFQDPEGANFKILQVRPA